MGDWLDRLKKEHDDLGEKLEKVSAFIGSSDFFAASYHHQVLLVEQRFWMSMYLKSITERLEITIKHPEPEKDGRLAV